MSKKKTERRDFLFTATAAVGAVGVGATVWPMIDQMNPDASVKALASTEVDVSSVNPGKTITVLWRGKPVFIRRRTQDEINEAKAVKLKDLKHPEKDEDRAKNPEWLVMLGVCTHLGCVPLDQKGDYNGWFCPCHGSHYDISGRIRKGPAPTNMEIPKYEFVNANTIKMSNFGKWFNDRLPLLTLANHLTDYPTPKNLNYWWTFGGILTFCLVTQIVTGLVLAMHYIAHADMAFDSVEHIMRDVNYGWLIRYIHANGASMFFLAVYIHIFRSLFYGSYKAPREIIWIIGIIIYLLMMAAAFMGYVLPWGQMSFWGATVITNLFSAIPLVGEGIVTWLWGGYSVDNPTLTRFFTLHYLIPFLILGLVVLHIWALHVPGNNNPIGIDVKKPSKDTVPFHPYIVIKDAFALLMFMIVFAFFVFYTPNILGHADNYIEANPLVTPAHIVPEWYLLPFYAILRSVPDKLMGVIAMLSAIFILAALPWLDTSKIRSAVFRPLYRQFYWILVADVLILGYVGAMPAEGLYLLIARVATAYYFLHFLVILPILGYKERTLPVPLSITEPVLGGSSNLAAARDDSRLEKLK